MVSSRSTSFECASWPVGAPGNDFHRLCDSSGATTAFGFHVPQFNVAHERDANAADVGRARIPDRALYADHDARSTPSLLEYARDAKVPALHELQ